MQKECFMINVFNKADGGSMTRPSLWGSELLEEVCQEKTGTDQAVNTVYVSSVWVLYYLNAVLFSFILFVHILSHHTDQGLAYIKDCHLQTSKLL